MTKGIDPIDYQAAREELPASFPWRVLLKVLVAGLAAPIALWLIFQVFWLLVLICYWFKHGKWPGWDAPLGG
jgi:hypothetical protein